MSAMSAYCTDASDARFISRICGVLWYATLHPSLRLPWLAFAPLVIGTIRRHENPLSRATRRGKTPSPSNDHPRDGTRARPGGTARPGRARPAGVAQGRGAGGGEEG